MWKIYEVEQDVKNSDSDSSCLIVEQMNSFRTVRRKNQLTAGKYPLKRCVCVCVCVCACACACARARARARVRVCVCVCMLACLYVRECVHACFMHMAVFNCSVFHCRGQDSVKHYKVTASDSGYKFGLAKFPNLTEFLQHFQSQPLLGGESGNLPAIDKIFVLLF